MPLAQREEKRGALAALALGPDTTAVAMNDALNDGEADTGSGKVIRRVQPLENSKEPVFPLHFKSFTVVADEKDLFPIGLRGAEFNRARLEKGAT